MSRDSGHFAAAFVVKSVAVSFCFSSSSGHQKHFRSGMESLHCATYFSLQWGHPEKHKGEGLGLLIIKMTIVNVGEMFVQSIFNLTRFLNAMAF